VLIAAADGLQIQWLLSPDSIDMGARLLDLTRLLAPPDGETSSASKNVNAEGR
jgi:hypothetical protein